MSASPHIAPEIDSFTPADAADLCRLVNTAIDGWPYCRAIGPELLAHWATLGPRVQPEQMLIARRAGRAVGCLHGEQRHGEHVVHFLAIDRSESGLVDALALLAHAERQARDAGMSRLRGPHWATAAFYGGYILGREPYHPHWHLGGTDAFVRAGFGVSTSAVILVAQPERLAAIEPLPAGYELGEGGYDGEFDAMPFRLVARCAGAEVATCGGRLYPRLRSARGGPVGQIGHVETSPEHRGHGLARILTTIAAHRLREAGAAELLIATGLDNLPALRAYERTGFERRHHIAEWSKPLAPPARG